MKSSQLDSDRQQIERLTDVVRPPSFAESARAGVQAHTPTPWQAGANFNPQLNGYGIISNGMVVASALYLGGTDPAKANAAFIVRAVNSHDALVGALRFILAFYEPGQRHLDTNAWKQAEAAARAALKNAEAV